MAIIFFILGASIGSFLNVLIDRLAKNESIMGRSHCDHCRHKLSGLDLIPVFSFVFLNGRCRYCKNRLSLQYPLIEIFTGLSFVFVMFYYGFDTFYWRLFADFNNGNIFDRIGYFLFILSNLGIISCFIVITISDFKYHLISDYVLIALAFFGLLYNLSSNINQTLIYLLYGLIVSFPIFLIYYFSRERAMGLGDVLISFTIGLLLGWQKGFLALYIAFITGAIFGTLLIVTHRKRMKSKIPFGPFLVMGTVIMLYYGDKIMEIVGSIYGL